MTPQSLITLLTKQYTKKVLPMVKYCYGENHIKKDFSGDFEAIFNKVHGKNYHITIC
jgi:hypothetical protein